MMKSSRLLIAFMFASGGLSQAAESNSISDDEETDIRFECIQGAWSANRSAPLLLPWCW